MLAAGATLSLTGRFAVQGEQARRGLQLWAEAANRAGGIAVGAGRREPVGLRISDDASRIGGATAGAERLILEDRVDLLFGPYSSVLTLAAAEVAERHGRVLWNHGGSSDAVVERGSRWTVSLLAPASRYFHAILAMAVTSPRPARRVALLHGARGTFPAAVVGGAVREAARLGLDVVTRAPYPERADDLAELVHRVRDLAPDLILGAGTTEADLALAREIRRQGVAGQGRRAPLVGLVAASIERFAEVLGPDAEGFVGPSQWEPGVAVRPDLGPAPADFLATFRARFGTEPDYPAAQAYAAGLVAARCVEVAGSRADAALRAAADALDLTTFYGRFRLERGTGRQVGHDLVVVQWQAGRKRLVWPPEVAEAPLRRPE